MERKLEGDNLRSKKLMIATPCYGGQNHVRYTQSLIGLLNTATHNQIHVEWFFLENESLVTRARNYCVEKFLQSDCTHLLFVDSDIQFSAFDALTLLHYADEDSPYDIICGPYPKKNISWEKVKSAVDKGYGDEDPQILENFVGDFVFNMATKEATINLMEPVEVREAGTGFMLIKRSTFEKFLDKYPEILYTPDHFRTPGFDGSKKIGAYFQDPIDPVSNRHLSEDYWFCQKAREAGMHVWVCPWMQLNHIGSYVYMGNLPALLSIGASINVDPKALKGNKKT